LIYSLFLSFNQFHSFIFKCLPTGFVQRFYQIRVKYYFLKVKLYIKFNKKVPQVPVCFSEKDLKELTKI